MTAQGRTNKANLLREQLEYVKNFQGGTAEQFKQVYLDDCAAWSELLEAQQSAVTQKEQERLTLERQLNDKIDALVEATRRIRTLTEAAEYAVSQIELWRKNNENYDFSFAREKLEAALSGNAAEPSSQWIPVAERLPEANTDVLVYGAFGMIAICRRLESGEWIASFGIVQGIAYWIPLPDAPKGEEE